MTERMTEERWREIRDSQRREYNRMIAETDPPSWEYDAIEDLAAEAERALAELAAAKAENERMREALRDIAYNTSTSIPFAAPPETFIVGQLHSCIRKAARALTPEPAP